MNARFAAWIAPLACWLFSTSSLVAEALPETPPAPPAEAPPAEGAAEPAPTEPSAPTAEASLESPPAPPAPTAVAPTEPPPDAVETKPEHPTKLGVAEEGFIKFGALAQFWALASMVDDETATTFRVRRAELKLSGEIIPETLAFKIVVDPAKVLESRNTQVPVTYEDPDAGEPATVAVPVPGDKLSILQDVAITYLTEYADVSAGQFKNGLSYEGFNSSSELIFPERSPVARYYGDKRDLGLSVQKDFSQFTYFLGLFNGSGLNLRDDDNQKDLALRLEVLPIEGLLLGAVGYTSLGQRDQATTKDRIEADVRVELANLLVQAEYLRGWDGPSDASVQGHGFYGALGYTFLGKLQPVVRVGQLDVDLDTGDDLLTHYDFGLNYYVMGQKARLSASVSSLDFEAAPTQTDVILMAQASF